MQYSGENAKTLFRLWTHKRHRISGPYGRAMRCLLWNFWRKLPQVHCMPKAWCPQFMLYHALQRLGNHTHDLQGYFTGTGTIIWMHQWSISHQSDVIMSTVASQIISISIVYSTVCSGANQRKHQSSVLLAFVRGIHQWPVNSPHKGPVTWKTFPFDEVMWSIWLNQSHKSLRTNNITTTKQT